MNVKITTLKIIAIVFSFFVIGCVPDDGASSNNSEDVSEVIMGDNVLYIPFVYFEIGAAGQNDSVLLKLKNVDFEPTNNDWNYVKSSAEREQDISILISRYLKAVPDNQMDIYTRKVIQTLSATEFVGKEFGLIHQAQPKDKVQDNNDIWLEELNGEYVSFVRCDDQIGKKYIPQCSQYFRVENTVFHNSFDKRLLPQWKKIKSNSRALFNSFQSKETALNFLHSKTNPDEQGDQP